MVPSPGASGAPEDPQVCGVWLSIVSGMGTGGGGHQERARDLRWPCEVLGTVLSVEVLKGQRLAWLQLATSLWPHKPG